MSLLQKPLQHCRGYIFSNTSDNFYFVIVWFNNTTIQEFGQTLTPSIEGTPSSTVIYKILKVDTVLQYSTHKLEHSIHKLDPRVALAHMDSKARSMKCTSVLLIT